MRVSMQEIVNFLRQYGEASTNEEFHGVSYWDDDQLLKIADQHSYRARVKIKTIQTVNPTIYNLKLPSFHYMENSFTVYDGDTVISSPVATYNQDRQELVFASALTEGIEYEVEALFVRMYDALGDLWSQKANQRYDYIDFKAGNNKMNMKQEYDHCVERAAYYRSKTIRRWPRQKGKWKTWT